MSKSNLMKKSLILFSFLALTTYQSNAQNSEDYKMTQVIKGGGHNFQIIGDASDAFADSLFSHLPETKRKGYVWKFKNVQITGIAEPVTFQVHQGLYGSSGGPNCDTSSCGGSSYFYTFTSEKYKRTRLSQNIPTEDKAILIYVKGRKKYDYVIKTKEEADLVRDYLQSLFVG